jgi:hypothetical protein
MPLIQPSMREDRAYFAFLILPIFLSIPLRAWDRASASV